MDAVSSVTGLLSSATGSEMVSIRDFSNPLPNPAVFSNLVDLGSCDVSGTLVSQSGWTGHSVWVITGVDEIEGLVWVLVWMETAVMGAEQVPTPFSTNVRACDEVTSVVWVETETLVRDSVVLTVVASVCDETLTPVYLDRPVPLFSRLVGTGLLEMEDVGL